MWRNNDVNSVVCSPRSPFESNLYVPLFVREEFADTCGKFDYILLCEKCK
jgi:hypothetical protein